MKMSIMVRITKWVIIDQNHLREEEEEEEEEEKQKECLSIVANKCFGFRKNVFMKIDSDIATNNC